MQKSLAAATEDAQTREGAIAFLVSWVQRVTSASRIILDLSVKFFATHSGHAVEMVNATKWELAIASLDS